MSPLHVWDKRSYRFFSVFLFYFIYFVGCQKVFEYGFRLTVGLQFQLKKLSCVNDVTA